MIENKVLVTVNVPSLESRYDVYIPVNRKIHSVIKMLSNSLFMLSQGSFVVKDNYLLYDANTGNIFDINAMVRDTDIRNGSVVILL